MGHTRESFRDGLWQHYARGINASYVFKWSRRGFDPAWDPDRAAAGGKRLFERFSYLILNPYGTPTNALAGIMDFKREMLAVDDLFAPRDRGVRREVALLISYPTERLAQATGNRAHNEVEVYARALEYAHYPIDVILEEQMRDEHRHSEYKVIVAGGGDAGVRVPFFDDALPDGWKMSGWGGVHPELVSDDTYRGSGRAIRLRVDHDAKAWCSTTIRTDDPARGIVLSPEIIAGGVLELHANGSKDEWGRFTGQQRVQLKLSWSATGGGAAESGGFIKAANNFVEGGSLDDSPETWQWIRIPLNRLLRTPVEQAVTGISIQYVSKAPAGGMVIDAVGFASGR